MRFAIAHLREVAVLGALLAVTGCVTVRETNPPRAANEELMISAAVDRVADKLTAAIPPDTKTFVDAQYFDALDGKYTIGAIRDRLLKLGAVMVADRASADLIVEIRSGAQSIDEKSTLVGIPSIEIPIPFAGPLKTPEIALFKKALRSGVAKVAMTGYGAKDGALKFSSGPEVGLVQRTKWTVLLFITWTSSDVEYDIEKE